MLVCGGPVSGPYGGRPLTWLLARLFGFGRHVAGAVEIALNQ